jgi:hypothetical protein
MHPAPPNPRLAAVHPGVPGDQAEAAEAAAHAGELGVADFLGKGDEKGEEKGTDLFTAIK